MTIKKCTSRLVAFLLLVPGILIVAGCFSVGNYREVVTSGDAEIPKDEIAEELERALDRPEGRREAAEAIVARIGTESDAGWLLALGLRETDSGALETRMRAALDSLDITNVIEADLPAGFPEPSVTDLVRIKSYPSFRQAQVIAADQNAEDDSMFMQLFDHIRTNDIPMTAPVDMSLTGESAGRDRMSFYYGSADVGTPGREGGVEVVDSSPLTVVSVSVRGGYSESNFREAVAVLEQWLEENGDRWVRDGEPRVLGYNSPFLPWFLKLSEVQIPVTERPRVASR